MKYLFIFVFIFLLSGCTINEEEKLKTLQDLADEIVIPETIDEDITLLSSYDLNGDNVIAIWTSDKTNVLTDEGVITRGIENQEVKLTLLLSGKDTFSKIYTVTVLGIGEAAFINNAIDTLVIPSVTKVNITLPNYIYFENKNLKISWNSKNSNIIDKNGVVGLISTDANTTLTLSITYGSETVTRDFNIKVIALTRAEQTAYIFNSPMVPKMVDHSVTLSTDFPFGITGTWASDTPDLMTNEGILLRDVNRQEVNLTLTLSNNETRTYTLEIINNNHMIIDRDFNGEKTNVEINNDGKLTLVNDAVEGTYVSSIFETYPFQEAVVSWAATSSTTATNEVFIRAQVDGVWSDYISYGRWGLGLNNTSPNYSNDLIKKSADEIIVQNNKSADAMQLKIILRRNASTNESPLVTLLATTINIGGGYYHEVDTSTLRKDVDYDVPKLNQNKVPGIGGIICSPTSSTMLMMFKGHTFPGTHPHEYFAGLVQVDPANNGIFGNWVYNTVGMSAYGETSYVRRMYSYEELLDHLDNVGPVAASVRGTMIGEIGKTWTTNGHLIVVRGYYYKGDQLYIRANDPNMVDVYEEYTIENFLKVWRNIVYVIE